ncbi:MAG: hypothetical protein ACQCXQ_10260 [Verrucomicrobiales bacterium]|nr:hypothetical protein [Verrucomicrobiota bacterium JB025]
MKDAVIVSRNGMGIGDPVLGLTLLARYLKADYENPEQRASRYVFYNGGVRAALLAPEVNDYLKKLEAEGALVLLCGTCLDHFELTTSVNVGKNACLGDVRESMAMARVDYL